MASLTKLLQLLVQMSTLDIVPKGYLTKIAAAGQILTGVGLLSGAVGHFLTTGEVPADMTLNEAFGLILLANGAATTGIARKVEAAPPKG